MVLSFIHALRREEIPVSVRHVLEFYEALRKGLAPDLDGLFLLSRLIFIKRIEHYDAFERVFASFFMGKDFRLIAADLEEALFSKPFELWLREEIAKGTFTIEELREFGTDELLRRFWETLAKQRDRHRHGRTWIGTGGTSPFGHGGREGGGIRVNGESIHGTAQKVIAARNYLNYSSKSTMARDNLRQVLASLRNFQPAGPETELDIDETISRTAKNGGEIDLVFTREKRDRLKLIVLLDNGGYSMGPYVELVKTVFEKIREQFKELEYFYFHNCIYGTVYSDLPRTRPVQWEDFTARGRDTRLIIIGDANMAPAELMAASGSLYFVSEERKSGLEWLRDLRAAFPASVWLNPIPRERWDRESISIDRIGRIFPMEDLTLAGIKNAVERLNILGQAVRA